MSGGVDSGLVAYAVRKALGDTCIAVTVRSALTPERDLQRAVAVAEHIGIRHGVLPVDVLQDRAVCANEADRCYHCKRTLFSVMRGGFDSKALLIDGTNADDDPKRPGLRAVKEFSVFSPLLAVGLTKVEVRRLACDAGLPNWNTPSESCLATRLPLGMELTETGLNRVEVMETFFHERGVDTLRASHDNLMASVEFMPQYAEIMIKNRDKFVALIKRIGLRSCEFKEWSP
ncbi:7-cyano-7-deazaguanine synthase [Pseudodesulfovibrio sediminis]|uniref:7-cyano-7-deazaguanine synthase n=2 Tax=Pseudodesulfovibrio sediminis TaxID=2810563 RepID=A0ABN6EU62_9BACT|nr:7-cyano-7-deazaguanine synthase [Pseudodesulfovibrio sediminis]